MLVVETIARIRRDHLDRGIPIKQITRDLNLSRNTVRKVVLRVRRPESCRTWMNEGGALAARDHKPDYRGEEARHGDHPTKHRAKHPLDQVGFERRDVRLVSCRSDSIPALVSCRSDSTPASTLAMSALVSCRSDSIPALVSSRSDPAWVSCRSDSTPASTLAMSALVSCRSVSIPAWVSCRSVSIPAWVSCRSVSIPAWVSCRSDSTQPQPWRCPPWSPAAAPQSPRGSPAAAPQRQPRPWRSRPQSSQHQPSWQGSR